MPGIYTASILISIVVIFSSCADNRKNKTTPPAKDSQVTYTDSAAIAMNENFEVDSFHAGYIRNATHRYVVKKDKVTRIGSPGKLLVTVDPAVLETADGKPVTGDIEVSITELLNSADLFKANAVTMSDGQLLVSGGSYYVGMTSGGNTLRIRKGKSLDIRFPILKSNEMELFYGQRDSSNTMNWARTGVSLSNFGGTVVIDNPDPQPEYPEFRIRNHLFDSGKSTAYFNNELTTIEKIQSYFRSKGFDKVLDTIYFYYTYRSGCFYGEPGYKGHPLQDGEIRGNYLGYYISNKKDTLWEGRSSYQLRMISAKVRSRERDSLLQARLVYDSLLRQWEKGRVTVQLNNYYDPTGITQLGWINCDRYYEYDRRDNIELELPITWNNGQIQYYLVYKSFNGLMSGEVIVGQGKPVQIRNLPSGQQVTFIAFARNKGMITHFKQDITIGQNKRILLDLKPINSGQLNEFFGKTSKI